MPIGEDIPMLVPISIVLTVVVLFLLGIFVNMVEQNEIVRMSQVSLDTTDYLANIVFSESLGNLDYEKIDDLGVESDCNPLEDLNITTNYNMKINVSDKSTGEWWCWKSKKSTGEEIGITNALPFAIINRNHTDVGEVQVIVSK